MNDKKAININEHSVLSGFVTLISSNGKVKEEVGYVVQFYIYTIRFIRENVTYTMGFCFSFFKKEVIGGQ